MKSLLAFMFVLAASMANGAWIFSRLERQHAELWTSMGKPTLASSNIGTARLKFMKWVWSLGFRTLADAPLRFACYAALAMEAALVLLAFAAWSSM